MTDNTAVFDFFRAFMVPLRLYENGALARDYSETAFQPNPLVMLLPYINENQAALGYILTDEQLFFGFVRADNAGGVYLLGPTTPFKPDIKQARSVLKAWKQNPLQAEALLRYLQRIPAYSVSRSRYMLSLLDFIVNGKTDRDIEFIPVLKTRLPQDQEMPLLSFIGRANAAVENEITSLVERGRPDLIEKYFNEMEGDGIPDIHQNADRALKNIFIFSTGVVSRTAFHAGADYDTVTEMTTHFLKLIEEKNGFLQIANCIRRMFMSFANIVALIKKTPSASPIANKIKQIVFSRMNEKITPTKIAGIMKMDVSYLCRHFKTQTGKTISSYINEVKIDECRRLLSATDMSVAEISVQLGFSSPNYMSEVFKKVTGLTPDRCRAGRN